MGDPRRRLAPLTPLLQTGIQRGPRQTESPFCPQVRFPLVYSQQLRTLLIPELIYLVLLLLPQEVVAAVPAAAVVVVVVVSAAAAAVVVVVDDVGGRGPVNWHPEQIL